ncbi:MAG TPA: DUF4337 domain-containing protein [Bryobacteraceae bacterium]|jgi:hypothetical protein
MDANDDLNEATERAKEPFDKKVAVTMAIIAALLAIDSVTAHIFSTEELLAQQKASDQWAFYQGKDIRRYNSEIAVDILKLMKSDGVEERLKHYADNSEKYDKDRADIQAEAKALEAERDEKGHKAMSLEIGEVFLEVGIVFASLAILSKRNIVWAISIISACVGVAVAATAVFVK